jgi:hypothetical protein
MVYFQTQNPNLGKFWRALDWKMLIYYTSIWNILWPLVTFCVHLLHFIWFWCPVPRKIWQPWCGLTFLLLFFSVGRNRRMSKQKVNVNFISLKIYQKQVWSNRLICFRSKGWVGRLRNLFTKVFWDINADYKCGSIKLWIVVPCHPTIKKINFWLGWKTRIFKWLTKKCGSVCCNKGRLTRTVHSNGVISQLVK